MTPNNSKTKNIVRINGTAVGLRGPRNANRRVEAIVSRLAIWNGGPEVLSVLECLKEVVLCADRGAELVELGEDWTVCRCRIHQPVECGEVGAEGCRGLGTGHHSAIRALYAGDHRACVAEAGVRVLDKKLFELVEFGLGRADDPLRKFGKGYGSSPGAFGAYYCYTHLFAPEIIVRIARLLGPHPKLVRMLRYLAVVGTKYVPDVGVQVLATKDVHIVPQGGMVPLWRVMAKLIPLVGPNVRVGATEAEVAVWSSCVSFPIGMSVSQEVRKGVKFGDFGGLQDLYGDVVQVRPGSRVFSDVSTMGLGPVLELLRSFGVNLPVLAYQDLCLAVYTAGTVPDSVNDGRQRLRMLALLGDRVIKMLLVLQGIAVGSSVAAVQGMESAMQSNGAMLRAAVDLGFVNHIRFAPGVASTSVNVVGTAVEVLLGVVAKWVGLYACHDVAVAFCVVPDCAMAKYLERDDDRARVPLTLVGATGLGV